MCIHTYDIHTYDIICISMYDIIYMYTYTHEQIVLFFPKKGKQPTGTSTFMVKFEFAVILLLPPIRYIG